MPTIVGISTFISMVNTLKLDKQSPAGRFGERINRLRPGKQFPGENVETCRTPGQHSCGVRF